MRATPLNVKFASKLGMSKEASGGMGICAECGLRICFDTFNGCLVALNFDDRERHPHQPSPPDPASNRERIANHQCVEGYLYRKKVYSKRGSQK
jgi:hypothetical protein